MKIKFFILILLTIFCFNAISQTDTTRKANNLIYIEAGGIGGYGSINYERLIFKTGKLKFGVRTGFSTYNLFDFQTNFNPDLIFPISIYSYYGKRHNIELGMGQTISNVVQVNKSNYKPERIINVHANFSIGYRYQKRNGGLIYRITYCPLIEFYKYYKNWFGFSIGYAF